jgi:hypothetical protein
MGRNRKSLGGAVGNWGEAIMETMLSAHSQNQQHKLAEHLLQLLRRILILKMTMNLYRISQNWQATIKKETK